MKIVTIGGGTGSYNILSALKQLKGVEISSIVSMSDDGGSTGLLRDEYGILPPGDLRRAIVALSDEEKTTILRDLFNYRFSSGGLSGHNLGNLIMLALEDIAGNYGQAVDYLEELFDINGKVYPVTFEKTRLLAKLEDGKYVFGEKDIDIPKHNGLLKIKESHLIKEEYSKIITNLINEDMGINESLLDGVLSKFFDDIPIENPRIKDVLDSADYIIVGPGDLYTSILPNFLVGNIKEYIKKSKAKKILFVNILTKYGETSNFSVSDFLAEYTNYLNNDIFDYIIAHDRDKYPISDQLKERYSKENKDIIKIDICDKRLVLGDFLKNKDLARHEPNKILKTLKTIIK